MYYEGAGEGETLVFLHGFTLDRRMWEPQAVGFQESYHVIRPDAKGHGLSDAPLTGYSRADRVDDLARLVDNLKIDRFHLVGLSMGGTTALGYALAHPERLRSLTLVSSGAAGYGVSKKITKLDRIARADGVKEALETWKRWSLSWYKDDLKQLGEFLEEMMDGFSGATWKDPMRGKYPRDDDMSRLGEIKVPTAIFAGSLDRIFAGLAKKLYDRIKGSWLKVYEGVGHMVNLEIPDRFNADLKAFLEGVSRS
jgi:pimeloyl-ACP methyl ester carboxylesterase